MHVTSNSFIIQLYPNVESISSYCLDYYYIIISHKWNQWYSALAFPFLCQILFPLKLVIAFFSPSTSFSNYHQFVTDSDGIIKPLSKRSSSLGNLLELYFPLKLWGGGFAFVFWQKASPPAHWGSWTTVALRNPFIIILRIPLLLLRVGFHVFRIIHFISWCLLLLVGANHPVAPGCTCFETSHIGIQPAHLIDSWEAYGYQR